MDYEAARRNMVESQIRTNKVTHAALLDALSAVPRERFLPPDRAFAAYVDDDVLVAPGRYLMEPMVFARMVQLAEATARDRALLVGAGAGYGAAVLARLVASVIALESDPALAARGKGELASLAVENASQVTGPLAQGWPGKAPYDLILIEGAVEEVPQALFDQLANGGRIVAVVKTEGMGRATLFIERNKVISHRPAFDAAVPLLAEFRRQRGFVF
jgi:protein-L-isoaspartate(D-aspartate) O-methyltransferase